MKKITENFNGIIESVSYAMHKVCTFFVFLYLFLMAVVFPFYLSNGYRNAGTDKSMLFRYIGLGLILSVLPCAVIYWLLSLKKEYGRNRCKEWCVSDIYVLLFGFLTVVSFLFSYNKQEALWGAEGWYMGLATQVTFVLSYFFVSVFLVCKKMILSMFLLSTFVTFVWGLLNRFSIYPIFFEGMNPGFIATLGNINWYCGYWSVFFPVGVGLFYVSIIHANELRWKNVLFRLVAGLYLAVATAVGAVQGSDSAILVFAAVTLVLYCVSAWDKNHRKAFYITVMVMCGVCQVLRLIRGIFPEAMNYNSISADILTAGNTTAILFFVLLCLVANKRLIEKISEKYIRMERMVVMSVVFAALFVLAGLIVINTISPGSIGGMSDNPVFTFNNKWGSSRGATWSAGIKVFADNSVVEKLIGLGPDSFAYGVYREGSSAVALVTEIFGNSRLTNAHNEWITVLVNTGILGLVIYVGMLITKTFRYISKGLDKNISLPIAFVCGLALVGYMSNNIFSFQQVLNGPFVYIMMGIGEAVVRQSRTDEGEINENSNL